MWTKRTANALLGALAAVLESGAVQALGDCPSRAAVERELSPLLGQTSALRETSVTITIDDQGDSYRVSVAGAQRLISDPLRDCDERAKVSAVFIALNLPTRSPPQAAPPALAPAPASEAGIEPPSWRVRLRALAGFEHAPEPARLATGLALGGTLRRGALGVGLSAGLQTPVTIASEGDGSGYELWRLPTALTLSYTSDAGAWGAGVEGGVAVDALHFRGISLPNPDSGLRLNAGLRVSVVLRLRANRSLAALLLPTLAYYPRTYLVRLEPTRLLGESPRFWWGVGIGLESSVLGG